MLRGSRHGGAVHWSFDGLPESATACNCTVCRRYAALGAHDFRDERIRASGPASVSVRGDSLGFHFCAACGCAVYWRSLEAGRDGRRRMAVNLRLAEPGTVGEIPVHRAHWLEESGRLPEDGRRVRDYWVQHDRASPLMITFRDRMARGASRTGWLESRHTFSFGEYRDPQHMGFRSLRVINEDRVIPGAGFPTHAHRDMEIISCVLEGTLEHRDSLGHGTRIRPGEVQRMSAGTGIRHGEFNPSASEPVNFLQIGIMPVHGGLAPGYEQKAFPPEERRGRLRLVAGPQGADGALTLQQDARLYIGDLQPGGQAVHAIDSGRGVWVQVSRAIAALNGVEMRAGDGAAVEQERAITLEADTDSQVLLFDLA